MWFYSNSDSIIVDWMIIYFIGNQPDECIHQWIEGDFWEKVWIFRTNDKKPLCLVRLSFDLLFHLFTNCAPSTCRNFLNYRNHGWVGSWMWFVYSIVAKIFHTKYCILCGFHKCLNRSWPKLINSSCDTILQHNEFQKKGKIIFRRSIWMSRNLIWRETEADEVWEVWMLLTTKRFINKIIIRTKRMKNLKKERKGMKGEGEDGLVKKFRKTHLTHFRL